MTNNLLLAVLLAAAPAAAQEGPLERALASELTRAMASLKQEGYPAAYHLSLSAIDTDSWELRCQMGARGVASASEQRLIAPNLRVGSYELDNHPVASATSFAGRQTARQDDEFSLRHALWLQLDAAYKAASADFLRKQALRVSRGKTEYDTDDLTRESPVVRPADRPASPWSTETLGALCEAGSKVFRGEPGLLAGGAVARLNRVWTRYRDSEGSYVDTGRDVAELELEAVSISTDGMKHYASRKVVATKPQGLPSTAAFEASAHQMLEDLDSQSVAATTSPFSAPALLDPEAAAAAVLAIAQRMSGEEQRNPSGAQTFKGKLGKRVLPEDLTLVDDPTRAEFGGTPLAGYYEFDDQGRPPQRVPLIENGVLRNFLLSRYPVVGFSKSNGHGRAFPGYHASGQPGSLFLTSRKPIPENRLLDRLREECRKQGKPYGLWIRGLRSFVQQQGAGGHGSIRFMPSLLYLVDARTGEASLVRDLDVVSTPLDLISNIVAAGSDVKAKNAVFGVPVSMVVPSVVLSDAELQRAETRPEKLPILPPPAPSMPLARPASPRIPFVPDVPYIQVQRYVLRGYNKPVVTPFVMEGLQGLRQHGEGADLIIEAKLIGRGLSGLKDALRRMDRSIERLAGGASIEKSSASPAMKTTDFQKQFSDGWPR
jgi:TldD protein